MSPVLDDESQTSPAEPDREIGPERFLRSQARARAAQDRGGRSPVRAVGAGLGLLLLVVGLPAALLALGAAPNVPTSWPDRETLAHALSLQQLVDVLVIVVWLAWLQFTVCLVVELVSAVRGVGLPTAVPVSGPSQRLARALVGALLITGAVAGPAAAAGFEPGTVPTGGPGTVATQAAAPGAAQAPAHGGGLGVVVRPDAPPAPTVRADVPEEVAALVGHKVYLVKTPDGRYHDNLWDIAEKHLGDGRRYKEIYQLNEGRLQPDGRRLELARLIQPGWQLVMPADATGVARFELPPVPTAPTTGAELGSEAPAPASGAAFELDGAGAHSAAHDVGGGVDVAAEQGGHATLAGGLVGAGLLAAGLLASLGRSRRRGAGSVALDDEQVDTEIALRLGADLDRAHRLDAALRSLAAGCRAQGLGLPPAYAARASSRELDLLVAPPIPAAPQGWQVHDSGRRWSTTMDDAPAAPSGDAPYPGLVSIGRDEQGRDVLLDLDAADGPVVLEGDPARAADVAVAMATSLATSPWSAALAVGVTGLPEQVLALAPERLHVVPDVGSALAALVHGSPLGDDVLTGSWGRAEHGRHEVLVLAADPGDEALAPLRSRSGQQAGGVVVAAEVPGATWRLRVDEAGTVEIAPLGLRVTGYQLDERTVGVLARLIAADRAADAAPDPLSVVGGGATLVQVPPPGVQVDDATWSASPSRIALLGPVQTRARGALDPSRIPLATEVLAFLAVHRDGVHPTVLAAALWPRGVGADVRDATLARVRDWVGDDASGHALLRTLPDGRLQLSDAMPSDWDVVCTLATRAGERRGSGAEVDLLRRALRVVRGPLLADSPQGRYAWIVRTRLEQVVPATVVAVAHRQAELLLGDDPAGAQLAAAAGLRLEPSAQVLWRDALQAVHAQDGDAGVAATARRMREALDDLGVPVDPLTAALVEELSPGLLARDA